jgi:hypothetical protein
MVSVDGAAGAVSASASLAALAGAAAPGAAGAGVATVYPTERGGAGLGRIVSAARPPNINISIISIEQEEIDVNISFVRVFVYFDFKENKMPRGGSSTISATSIPMRRPAISPSGGRS